MASVEGPGVVIGHVVQELKRETWFRYTYLYVIMIQAKPKPKRRMRVEIQTGNIRECYFS